jgi:tRNA pseudouridine55 synthase
VWRRIDGVLLLDKPIGLSSNDALQRARRALCAASGGHGGTLDPLATGLLPLAFGEATKFLNDLLEADKTYRATIQLGICTDSGDAEGQVLSRRPVEVTGMAIDAACAAFVGPIHQVPPMHSALKQAGRPLYELARAGQSVERAARAVTVHRLDVLGKDLDLGQVDIEVCVSKGTYIRTLAQDIGERLGCGAHLAALRRTQVGSLALGDAVTLSDLEALDATERDRRLAPLDTLIHTLPVLNLPDELARRFTQGQRIILDHSLRAGLPGSDALLRVYQKGRLLGVADFQPPGRIAPKRLVQPSGCAGASEPSHGNAPLVASEQAQATAVLAPTGVMATA